MKDFKVKVKFVFEGEISIKAISKGEAVEYIGRHVGMTTSRGIHTSLPDEIIDWEFPVHAEKIISTPKLCKEESTQYSSMLSIPRMRLQFR